MLDVIGIGLGPFNLSLAALLDKTNVRAKFFEQKPEFNWHKGMILPATTLQVPFMADLVTMIDPTSRYSFLNYLHTQKRLLKFYFLEEFKIYREEYNHYCQWVAGQLDSLYFATTVMDVQFYTEAGEEGFAVTVSEHGETHTHYARHLVIGTGTHPTLPAPLQTLAKDAPARCMHTAQFTERFDLDALTAAHDDTDTPVKVLVLGSGQSSAEVYRALFDQQMSSTGMPKFILDWFTRSAGFFPMEYSPLGLEHFSPAYTDYFYHLPRDTKAAVSAKQDLLYKGMGFGTIRDIYHHLYERSIRNQPLYSNLRTNCALISAEQADADAPVTLAFTHSEQQQRFMADYDCVIAGTGYRYQLPDCLAGVLGEVQHDAYQQPEIGRDYTLRYCDKRTHTGKIFVQNQEVHSHGVGAPDLGLGAYRAGYIINELLGVNKYDTDALEVFQDFGAA
ncbi:MULTISPECIES: lysine N(6)-hydroxylase/L-ornithine N(5)-oxygenase family protein [unclassified Psychrobacter]|uniref:lysine N(6)-hydroxylase/L-ornithine N(5)-oxygenase family protein n=1 Tax=unclassified Psychrobacter TaxID=196806 RepID=UPI0018F429E2|nr:MULTISPECIES: SidA/IucD/PvdA family monooxygenase [unclassified Psychrobacter]